MTTCIYMYVLFVFKKWWSTKERKKDDTHVFGNVFCFALQQKRRSTVTALEVKVCPPGSPHVKPRYVIRAPWWWSIPRTWDPGNTSSWWCTCQWVMPRTSMSHMAHIWMSNKSRSKGRGGGALVAEVARWLWRIITTRTLLWIVSGSESREKESFQNSGAWVK